jgi:hypothetical protein
MFFKRSKEGRFIKCFKVNNIFKWPKGNAATWPGGNNSAGGKKQMIATQTGYYKQLVPQPLFSQTETKRQPCLGRQTEVYTR